MESNDRKEASDSLYDTSPDLIGYEYLATGYGWIECTPQVFLEMEGLGCEVRKIYAALSQHATQQGNVDG